MSAVERAINLNRSKLNGIVTEKILRPHAHRIEAAFPTGCGERRSAEQNLDAGNLKGLRDFLRCCRSNSLVRLIQWKEEGLAVRLDSGMLGHPLRS